MNAKEINAKLHKYQDEWERRLLKPYLSDDSKGQSLFPVSKISRPFCIGISDVYASAEKRIMIIGQQTGGWPSQSDLDNWPLIRLQELSIQYLEEQLAWREKVIGKSKNCSPFWNFFRRMMKEGWAPCWNNLDKIQSIGPSDELSWEQEEMLNKPLSNNKSLLQTEIELTKPDRIVFIVGPRYVKSLCSSMGLKIDALEELKPNSERFCVDITDKISLGIPVFWTYHPNFLSRHKGKIAEVVSMILESC